MRPRRRSPADLSRFQEISEAGARNAATALSQMIGRPVHLDVPWAKPVPLEDVPEIAGGARRVVCALSLKVYGGARGNLLLLFGEEQVPRLLDLLLPGGADGRGVSAALSDLDRSALREVANILAAAYLNAVSHLLGVSLLPSIPGLAFDMAGAVTDFLLIEQAPVSDTALVLASEIREPRSGLRGEFFFLPDPKSLPPPPEEGRRQRPGRRPR
ncbi:MAG TPA: chemotaxis protein CheC [Candidatus Polarisedimenticolia bacterium]|nr:chemotaxis protein CheC [Candidatus Polarisedimenticolia bacterium]